MHTARGNRSGIANSASMLQNFSTSTKRATQETESKSLGKSAQGLHGTLDFALRVL